MHFQSPIPSWTDVLTVCPEKAFIKTFAPEMLVEAKNKWASLGRDRSKLFTDYRHFDLIYPFDRTYTFDELKTIWRLNFKRFIGDIFINQYAPHIDGVETLNEYFDTRMADDPVILKPYLLSAQAAVSVWESDYRGKLLPSTTRLILGNSPVGNDIPKEFYQLALNSDSILGTHPYTKWANLQRDPQDFQFHSGRWNQNELKYGLKPIYAFTECGPYLDAGNGWRYSGCMNGDLNLLVSGMRRWIQDVKGTAAYREGRILGPGAIFTSGGFDWQMYQVNTAQLVEVYKMFREEWHIPEVDMDEATKVEIRSHAQAIIDLTNGVLFKVKVIVPVLNIRSGPGVSNPDIGDALLNTILPVYKVDATSGWLRIDPVAERWVSGGAAFVVKV